MNRCCLCVQCVTYHTSYSVAVSNARGSHQVSALPSGSTGYILWQTALLMGHPGSPWYETIMLIL